MLLFIIDNELKKIMAVFVTTFFTAVVCSVLAWKGKKKANCKRGVPSGNRKIPRASLFSSSFILHGNKVYIRDVTGNNATDRLLKRVSSVAVTITTNTRIKQLTTKHQK